MLLFFNQKTAYEMRISDWSSDVCSSDLRHLGLALLEAVERRQQDGSGDHGGGQEEAHRREEADHALEQEEDDPDHAPISAARLRPGQLNFTAKGAPGAGGRRRRLARGRAVAQSPPARATARKPSPPPGAETIGSR